jgi:branched-chain amino acid transport system substrate-binding protein
MNILKRLTTWLISLISLVSSIALTSFIGSTYSQTAVAEILIGQTAGFTGPVGAGVTETTNGAKIYFNNVNSMGGINGQKITLISLDDKFDPKLSADNAQRLIEEKNVVAIFLTRGTPHTQAIIPLLNKYGVPLVGPSTGAMVLQQPFQKYIFNVRSTYQREAEKAISHLSTIGISRIGIIHVDDSFGADAVLGAQRGLKEAKLQALVYEKFDRVKPDLNPIVKKLTTANVQAVLIVGAGLAVADALVAMRAQGSAAQIITLSNNASAGFIKSLNGKGPGVIVTQVFPNERSINYPLVKEAQALAKAQGLETISPAMLEGFTAAKVLVAGLRRAGAKPSREKLQFALEALREFDVGGLKINYSTTAHTGLDFADLSIIGADEKFKR